MQAPESQKYDKNLLPLLTLLLITLLASPIAVLLAPCILQACLWQFVLSKLDGVFFSLSFTEAILFCSSISAFAFLIVSISSYAKFVRAHKTFKDYLADAKSQQEARATALKSKPMHLDWQLVRETINLYAGYIAINIVALCSYAYLFPTKLAFEGPSLILYCALICTAVRALYWQFLYLVSQYGNDAIERHKPDHLKVNES